MNELTPIINDHEESFINDHRLPFVWRSRAINFNKELFKKLEEKKKKRNLNCLMQVSDQSEETNSSDISMQSSLNSLHELRKNNPNQKRKFITNLPSSNINWNHRTTDYHPYFIRIDNRNGQPNKPYSNPINQWSTSLVNVNDYHNRYQQTQPRSYVGYRPVNTRTTMNNSRYSLFVPNHSSHHHHHQHQRYYYPSQNYYPNGFNNVAGWHWFDAPKRPLLPTQTSSNYLADRAKYIKYTAPNDYYYNYCNSHLSASNSRMDYYLIIILTVIITIILIGFVVGIILAIMVS